MNKNLDDKSNEKSLSRMNKQHEKNTYLPVGYIVFEKANY